MDTVDVWVVSANPPEDEPLHLGLIRVFGIEEKAARTIAATLPRAVRRDVPRDAGVRYQRALESIGAVVELVPHGERPGRRSHPPLASMPPPRASQLPPGFGIELGSVGTGAFGPNLGVTTPPPPRPVSFRPEAKLELARVAPTRELSDSIRPPSSRPPPPRTVRPSETPVERGRKGTLQSVALFAVGLVALVVLFALGRSAFTMGSSLGTAWLDGLGLAALVAGAYRAVRFLLDEERPLEPPVPGLIVTLVCVALAYAAGGHLGLEETFAPHSAFAQGRLDRRAFLHGADARTALAEPVPFRAVAQEDVVALVDALGRAGAAGVVLVTEHISARDEGVALVVEAPDDASTRAALTEACGSWAALTSSDCAPPDGTRYYRLVLDGPNVDE